MAYSPTCRPKIGGLTVVLMMVETPPPRHVTICSAGIGFKDIG